MATMFQKRHYELFAKALRGEFGYIGRVDVTRWLVDIFAADNPRFDVRRFVQAAEVEWDDFLE